jgi:hypothetical protein
MIKPKSPKDSQWYKNERSKLQRHPKATFDILMVKYKEGRADIRGHENWTIRNTKLDSPVSLSQTSTSAAGSSSSKRSRALSRQISKGRDRRQQDYHSVSYFLVGPPMPRPWGPPPMMYPPCPPWTGWYELWVPPPMHFHPRWLGSTEDFSHGG